MHHKFQDTHGSDVYVNLEKVFTFQSYSSNDNDSPFTELNFGTHTLVINLGIKDVVKVFEFYRDSHI